MEHLLKNTSYEEVSLNMMSEAGALLLTKDFGDFRQISLLIIKKI